MFFGKAGKRNRIEASQKLTQEIEKYFTENLDTIYHTLKLSGIPPEEFHEIVQQVKRDTQLAAIKQFKEILERKMGAVKETKK